jgi:multidrug transporter EmrE-like cation transporter
LALYLFGAMLWLLVLAKIDVTQAYPFVGLGFLITMALGMIWLGESVSSARFAGTVLVATGVILVARS